MASEKITSPKLVCLEHIFLSINDLRCVIELHVIGLNRFPGGVAEETAPANVGAVEVGS